MTEADSIKWALLDLLKVLDAEYGGRMHGEFARIARGLGVELPPVRDVVLDDIADLNLGPLIKEDERDTQNNWKAGQARKMKVARN